MSAVSHRSSVARIAGASRLMYGAIAAIAAFAVITPPALHAQQPAAPAPLSLGDVYRELRAASPRVAAAGALARAAGARVAGAALPTDPQLQVGWMNYDLRTLAPMEPLGMVQLQVMQMLPLGGKLALARGIAQSRASVQSQRAEEVWWEARAATAMAFYELYQVDERLGVMRETLRLLGDARRTAEAMYRVGQGRQADVLRAQLELTRMIEDTLRMSAMRSSVVARLNAALDRPHDAVVAAVALPDFPAELPAVDVLQQAAEGGRPMHRAAGAELAGAKQMQRLARRELIPDLQLGIQYSRRSETMVGADAMGEVASRRTTAHMGSFMIGASVPIFARSRQLQMREEADAMRQMAAAELAAMRAETRSRLGAAHADLQRVRRLATLYRTTLLPQLQALVASAHAAYRAGQVDFMTLFDNQMTASRYRQDVAVLQAEEGRAWAELEMLTGRELLPPDPTRNVAAPEAPTGGVR